MAKKYVKISETDKQPTESKGHGSSSATDQKTIKDENFIKKNYSLNEY